MPRVKKTYKQLEAARWAGEPKVALTPADAGYKIAMINALNWYRANATPENYREWFIAPFKESKVVKEPKFVAWLNKVPVSEFDVIGIMSRMMTNGVAFDPKAKEGFDGKVRSFRARFAADAAAEKAAAVAQAQPKLTVRDRVEAHAANVIVYFEDFVDKAIVNRDFKSREDFYTYMLADGVKAPQAKLVASRFTGIKRELDAAIAGKDAQLVEGYSNFTRPQLKNYAKLIGDIVADAVRLQSNAKVQRKPRKKKIVPVSQVVGKMKYCASHAPLKLTSVDPTQVIGAEQLWVYNIKTRKIGVYKAQAGGLSIKGSTVQNFVEAESVAKTLRKPEDKLNELLAAGKVALRKYLIGIRAVESALTGRIGKDTVLVKVVK